MTVETPKRATSPTRYVAKPLHRPGWVTFAAVVSFVVGAYYVLVALSEFSNSYWLYNGHVAYVYNLAGQHLFWWGIFDSIIAVMAIGAGFSLLRGGFFGVLFGMTAAGFSAIRWLFYVSVTPWLAMTIIAVDILVIYGLAMSMDYFADSDAARSSDL